MLVDRHDAVTRNAALLALIGQRNVDADVLTDLDAALSDQTTTDPAARRAQIAAAVIAAGGE